MRGRRVIGSQAIRGALTFGQDSILPRQVVVAEREGAQIPEGSGQRSDINGTTAYSVERRTSEIGPRIGAGSGPTNGLEARTSTRLQPSRLADGLLEATASPKRKPTVRCIGPRGRPEPGLVERSRRLNRNHARGTRKRRLHRRPRITPNARACAGLGRVSRRHVNSSASRSTRPFSTSW